jgi:hypothetical protein
VNDAFEAARRKLDSHVERRRRKVKQHPLAEVA